MAQIKKSLYKVLFLKSSFKIFYVLQKSRNVRSSLFSPILFFARDSSINSSKTYNKLQSELAGHFIYLCPPSSPSFDCIPDFKTYPGITKATLTIQMIYRLWLIIVIIYGLHVCTKFRCLDLLHARSPGLITPQFRLSGA